MLFSVFFSYNIHFVFTTVLCRSRGPRPYGDVTVGAVKCLEDADLSLVTNFHFLICLSETAKYLATLSNNTTAAGIISNNNFILRP